MRVRSPFRTLPPAGSDPAAAPSATPDAEPTGFGPASLWSSPPPPRPQATEWQESEWQEAEWQEPGEQEPVGPEPGGPEPGWHNDGSAHWQQDWTHPTDPAPGASPVVPPVDAPFDARNDPAIDAAGWQQEAEPSPPSAPQPSPTDDPEPGPAPFLQSRRGRTGSGRGQHRWLGQLNEPRANPLEPREGRLLARHLAKSFSGRMVLRDVSFAVDRGEVVGLLGPNGAGKTTSFYMVCGLLIPDAGQITIDGRDITRRAVFQRARLGLGYLPQEASIFRGLTVEKNILAILETRLSRRRDRRDRLEQLLDEFSIQHIRKSPALALSGGERRRVEIARALAAEPNYLLLDEPFAGVDPIAVGDIRKLVSQLKNRGIGILITDHNVRETLGVVDRAYIIFDGQVLKQGQPQEIVADPAVRDVYLGQQFAL